jgi:hypothetical protein
MAAAAIGSPGRSLTRVKIRMETRNNKTTVYRSLSRIYLRMIGLLHMSFNGSEKLAPLRVKARGTKPEDDGSCLFFS